MAPVSRENNGVDTMVQTDGPRPLEIVFSFDTTGSMNSCIGEVRKKVQEIMERLSKDIPALRMAVFAHGDYCDAHNYVTKWLDFTTDVTELCNFVKNVTGTGGGDYPECYELVLRQVRTELSWTPGTKRSLVMIGDAIPHEASDPQNKLNIDWKDEVDRLYNDKRVRIYSVQCGSPGSQNERFCKTMVEKSNGTLLRLENFETMVDMMMSIVFRERGTAYFEEFEKEVRAREGAGIRWELDRMLNTLAYRSHVPSTSAPAPVIPLTAAVSPMRTSSVSKPPPTPVKAKPTTGLKAKKAVRKLFKSPLKGVRESGIKKTGADKTAKKLLVPKTIKRVLRESVIDRHLLKDLKCDGWHKAMQLTEPKGTPFIWKQRQNHPGYRCKGMFNKDSNVPAMFELAVTTPECRRKVPVWCGFTKGLNGKDWDQHFLRNATLKREIDTVLERGCKLYLRKFTGFRTSSIIHRGHACSNMESLKNLINKTYDYAWSNKAEARQLFLRRSRRNAVLAKKGQPY